ncbi:MAG: glycosyltransferase family 4 protein [Candidatus Dormibacteria bacterium]
MAIDSSACRFDHGGTATYIEELLRALGGIEDVQVAEIGMHRSWPLTNLLPRRLRIVLHDLLWIPRGSTGAARAAGAEILHGPAFRVAPSLSTLTTVTVHDDTPWEEPPTASRYTRWVIKRSVRRAIPTLDGMITVSSSAARSIASATGYERQQISVVHHGVNHALFKPREAADIAAQLRQLGVDGPYVLLVAPFGPRKNASTMLAALESARTLGGHGFTVVVTGDGHLPRTSLRLHRVGRVTQEELAILYSGALFLLFASLKEGFGLPIIEAMASGCPVITSRGGATEEIAGTAAVLVDSHVVPAMAGACAQALEERGVRERMARAGIEHARDYTWERCAELTVQAWRELSRAPR